MDVSKKLVVGNWKMNGSLAGNAAFLEEVTKSAGFGCAMAICVPFPYLAQASHLLSSASEIALGAQNVSEFDEGAYTGEVSARMLSDLGCSYVIVGHSERRTLFREDDGTVGRKARAALGAGLLPIVCVGETLAQRNDGVTLEVVTRQLDAVAAEVDGLAVDRVVLAYEPVWAIGSGLTATTEQVGEVHASIRVWAQRVFGGGVATKILYGGSVKPGNAAELFAVPNVDGGLIGGASLVARDFLAICRAAADY